MLITEENVTKTEQNLPFTYNVQDKEYFHVACDAECWGSNAAT